MATELIPLQDLDEITTPASNDLLYITETATANTSKRIQYANLVPVTLTNTVALTNKDLSSGTNTFPSSFITLTGVQTLTNKDLSSGTNTFPGSLVTLTGSQTLTNKVLTSPTINTPTITTPTIASFANANHDHDDAAGGGLLNATNVFSTGTVPTARLGSGSASATTFLRGDQTYATPLNTGMYFSSPTSAGGFDRNAAVLYIGLTETSITTSEAIHQMNIGAGTFKEIRIRVTNNSMSAATTLKLRVNGADSSLTLSITATTTGNFSATGSVTVAAGDLVDYSFTSAASTAANHLDYQSLIIQFVPAS